VAWKSTLNCGALQPLSRSGGLICYRVAVCNRQLPSGIMVHQTIVRDAAAYVAAVALLCVPALWNGFPLVFDDVGGYVERWPTGTLGLGRSTVYGLLLWITRSAAFLPVIMLQALVTTFVVDRAIKVFAGPGRPRWLLPSVIAAMAATSGVALFVSKVIPDAWTAPGVLALHLLAWHAESLTKFERVVMAAIVAFAGASHMATFAVLAGLSVLYAIAWLARRRLDLAPAGIGFAVAAAWSGLLLLLAGNVIVTGRLAIMPGGEIFLLGRMVEDGMAGEILSEECPRPDWQLCIYRDALPSYAEAFIFDADSPLQKIGGAHDPRARNEIASIIARSLVRHPLAHAERAVKLTAKQFVDLGTGDAMEPLMSAHTRWILARYAPSLVPRFDTAHQQTDTMDLSGWSDWVVVPISIIASFALPVLALLSWRHGRRREAMLPALLFLALLGNAAICGVVSNPNARYQARLVWLAELAVGLVGYPRLRRPSQIPITPNPWRPLPDEP
jgi:hypothetical protein